MIGCLCCRYVKDADKEILNHLKADGRVVHLASVHHSYPFCWRSDTALIYRVSGNMRPFLAIRFVTWHCSIWKAHLFCRLCPVGL